MSILSDTSKFEAVLARYSPDSKLRHVSSLVGGISAQVLAIAYEDRSGQSRKVVFRQHGDVDFRLNPNVAYDEFRLLEILREHNLPVPTPLFVDTSSEIFERPYLLIEFIDAIADYQPENIDDHIGQMAETLAKIHTVDTVQLPFLGKTDSVYTQLFDVFPNEMDETLRETYIREVLQSVCPARQINRSVLIHGDYWNGNTMWRNGKLVAVIDWEDAALADPLADLSNTRMETLWSFGVDVMEEITRRYFALMPDVDMTNLPVWDLRVALYPAFRLLDFAGGDAEKEKIMREQHHWFVDQAIKALA